MSDSTLDDAPDLTDTQQFWLGVARADTDVEEQSASVRIAQETGRISNSEASEKLVIIRQNHYDEVVRLRDRYLDAKGR